MSAETGSGRYNSKAKAAWRTVVWSDLAAAIRSPRTAHAMLLPSSEGLEVGAALAAGFSIENLHAVDHRPGKMAALNRRYGNRLNTYGCAASAACKRIAYQGGKLEVANFDFMGCINQPMCREIREIGLSGVFEYKCAIGFTLQRGREPTKYSRLLKAQGSAIGGWANPERDPNFPGSIDLTETDAGRGSMVIALLGSRFGMRHVFRDREAGVYWSGHLSMFWITLEGDSSEPTPEPAFDRQEWLDLWNSGYEEGLRVSALGATA